MEVCKWHHFFEFLFRNWNAWSLKHKRVSFSPKSTLNLPSELPTRPREAAPALWPISLEPRKTPNRQALDWMVLIILFKCLVIKAISAQDLTVFLRHPSCISLRERAQITISKVMLEAWAQLSSLAAADSPRCHKEVRPQRSPPWATTTHRSF